MIFFIVIFHYFINMILVILLALISTVSSAKILIINLIASKSHNGVFQKYANELLHHGHAVTVVDSFPPDSLPANYTHISTLGKVFNTVDEFGLTKKIMNRCNSVTGHLNIMHSIESDSCETILSIPEIKDLYQREEAPFDLLVGETYYVSCLLPIAVHLKKPYIQFLTPHHIFTADVAIGNINNPSILPTLVRDYKFALSAPTAFTSRLNNFINYWLYYVRHVFVHEPSTKRICQKHFKNLDCSLNNLLKSISIVFSYGHSQHFPRPIMPNYVEIGGMHIAPPSSLPPDLETFIQESEYGVIYVSFGSTIKMSLSDEPILDKLLQAFSNSKCRIIWRSDLDIEGNKSFLTHEKILTRNWLPQVNILAHQNVKIFITQGGIHSIYEAIYTGTPVIGIPLWFDQYDNVQRVEELGGGILVETMKLYEQLEPAIHEILHNNMYSKNMQKLSKKYHDRPMAPLDVAIYWTEYALRHNQSFYWHPAAFEIPLYQYLLLDIIVVPGVTLIIIIYGLVKILNIHI